MDCPKKRRGKTHAGKKLTHSRRNSNGLVTPGTATDDAIPLGMLCLTLLLLPMLCGCATFSRPIPPFPENAIKPVLAVTEFGDESSFPGQWRIGRGMADLLVAELLSVDRYVVVERRKLDDVLGEITRQGRDFFRKEGGVQKGRLKNARYLVRGVVTDFTQTGSSSAWFRNASAGAGIRGSAAVVMIAVTVTDVETGEIVSSVRAGGTRKASGKWAEFEYRNTSFGGDVFNRTPIGRATQEAINKAVRQIIHDIPVETWQPRVADVIGETVTINGGRNVGVRLGSTFNVRETSRNITDPHTGDVVGIVPGEKTGKIRITAVHETFSNGIILSGTARRGYRLDPVEEAIYK